MAKKRLQRYLMYALPLVGPLQGSMVLGSLRHHISRKKCGGAVDVMLAIKKAIDPNNIMNPGKAMVWEGCILQHLRYPCKDYQDGSD